MFPVIALVFHFRSSNLSESPLNVMYLMAPEISSLSYFILYILLSSLLFPLGTKKSFN